MITEEDDEDPSNEHKQWCTGRVGNLKLKTTAYKFTTVPQTAACFAGHDIYRTGDEADHPARNIVDALKAHVEIFEIGPGF